MTPTSESESHYLQDITETDSAHNLISALRSQIVENELKIARLSAENQQLKMQWKLATSSISWKIINKLSKIAGKIAPKGTIRRKMLKSGWQAAMLVHRHGPLAWLRRFGAKCKFKLNEKREQWSAETKAFSADDRPVIISVSHVGGGGTERHVRDMASRLASQQVRSVYARPDLSGRLVFEERSENWKLLWRRVILPDESKCNDLLNIMKPALVHVHHTMGVPQAFFNAIKGQNLATDFTLHDYHSICPRIHLNDEKGRYCGEPDGAGCNSCLKRLGDYHGQPFSVAIDHYRSQWSDRLAGARKIYVPSDDVNQRLSRYFPGLNIETRPHIEPSRPNEILARKYNQGEKIRVAVIGTIGSIKGSAQLLEAARDAADRQLPLEFVLVGTSNLEPQLLATKHVELTGPYFEHEVWARLDEAACHLAWLPSIWPETYMYTLSVAQLAGFWPMVYDLGAQAQRVKSANIGDCISLDLPPDQLNDLFIQRARELELKSVQQFTAFAEYPNFLEDYYGLSRDQLKSLQPGQISEDNNTIQIKNKFNLINPSHASRSDHAHLHEHHCQLSA
jgi:glycosyltransferase involved in cell wall biosynthesis